MTDLIIERLRASIRDLASGAWDSPEGRLIAEAADEIERLLEREAELQAQCGYTESIKTVEIERLRAEFELFREAPSKLEVAQYEIERLREKVEMVMSINHQQGEEIERLRAALGEKP